MAMRSASAICAAPSAGTSASAGREASRPENASTADQNAATVIGLTDIEAARRRIDGIAVRTPLVRLPVEGTGAEIFLKLENLQPIGSFKIRGASSYMTAADPKA